ncbi:MAG: Twin-arginine translocation protein TatC, partial [uncultured Solirubrobacterales bacterium]
GQTEADRPPGPAEPRRAPRRAALARPRVDRGARARARRLRLEERCPHCHAQPAAADGPGAHHAQSDRALPHYGDARGLRRDPARVAGHPLPGLRVRTAGLLKGRATGRAPSPARCAGALRRGRRVRLSRRAATGDHLPSGLQRRRVQHATACTGVLQLRVTHVDLARDPLSGAYRRARGHAPRCCHSRPASQGASLRDPRDRGARGVAPHDRPGHDDPRDGAADRALRVVHPRRARPWRSAWGAGGSPCPVRGAL